MYLQRDTQFLLNDEIIYAMPSIYTTQEAESQSEPAHTTPNNLPIPVLNTYFYDDSGRFGHITTG